MAEMFDRLNAWTDHYNNGILDGKWADFFNWQPYHWFRSEKIDPPYCTPEVLEQVQNSPKPRFLPVCEAVSVEGVSIDSEMEGDIPLWIEALTPVENFSKAAQDNVFCHVVSDSGNYDASATPINNIWHASYVGPMWSRVGMLHLKKGSNRLAINSLKPGTRIYKIYMGLYPPFEREPRLRIPASLYQSAQGGVERVEGLGYTDGVLAQPFDTSSYQQIEKAPFVEYELDLYDGDTTIEVRTLPTLHLYEGRDARYAVQLGDTVPQVFSIQTEDFTAEWRSNVLRGYASRSLSVAATGRQRLRIYLLDPGIVLQEVLIHSKE